VHSSLWATWMPLTPLVIYHSINENASNPFRIKRDIPKHAKYHSDPYTLSVYCPILPLTKDFEDASYKLYSWLEKFFAEIMICVSLECGPLWQHLGHDVHFPSERRLKKGSSGQNRRPGKSLGCRQRSNRSYKLTGFCGWGERGN
jgi:hypothetical protein